MSVRLALRLLLFLAPLLLAPLGAWAETTVVLVPGLGDGPESFGRLARKLKGTAPVYRDDRSGAGAGTGAEAADQLAARLAESDQSPPYLLVGHSLGGLHVLAFAERYPEQVAGVVLVDARLPDFEARCRTAGLNACEIPHLMLALMPASQRNEVSAAPAIGDYVRPVLKGFSVPMTVIAAGKPGLGLSAEWQALWVETARRAAESAGARFVLVKSAGHYVHKDAPDLVRDEIVRLLPP